MNLPMRLLLSAAAATLLFTAFTSKPFSKKTPGATPATSAIAAPAPAPAPATKQIILYWYALPYDDYNDYKTIAQEEFELEEFYGVPVDTSPYAGTLLEKGYINNVVPHNTLPYAFLYGHFPYIVDGPGRKAQ